MEPKLIHSLRSVAIAATATFGMCLPSFGQKLPPAEVAHLYSQDLDKRISDDFNGPIEWDTKWTYRANMGGKDQIAICQDEADPDNKYVSIKALGSTRKGAGLCTMNDSKYGFYIVKWRTKGIVDGVKNNWHPSTWASCVNFGVNKRDKGRPYQRIELDLMEGFGIPDWGSHLNAWTGKSTQVYTLKERTKVFPKDGEWSVIGMEYTPDYIAGWEFKDGKWNLVKTIEFTADKNDGKKLNYSHREHVYWIHSNIFIDMKAPATDSEYQVDYFYHYPYKCEER